MQKSIDAWNRVRALDPDHPALLAGDGWEAMNRGEYKIAARLIDKALSGDSKSFDVVEVAIIFSMAIRRADLATAQINAGTPAVAKKTIATFSSRWPNDSRLMELRNNLNKASNAAPPSKEVMQEDRKDVESHE